MLGGGTSDSEVDRRALLLLLLLLLLLTAFLNHHLSTLKPDQPPLLSRRLTFLSRFALQDAPSPAPSGFIPVPVPEVSIAIPAVLYMSSNRLRAIFKLASSVSLIHNQLV